MSFILDALKKLEKNMRDSSVPDLLTVHTAEMYDSKKRPIWAYVLITALLLNAGILYFRLLPGRSDNKEVITDAAPELRQGDSVRNQITEPDRTVEKETYLHEIETAEAIAAPQKGPLTPSEQSEKVSGPVIALEPEKIVVIEEEQQARIERTDIPSEQIPIVKQLIKDALSGQEVKDGKLAVANIQGEAPAPEINALSPADLYQLSNVEYESAGDIPTFSELPQDVKKDLPKIVIIAHIYSDNPSARIVNVNGDILREGETVSRNLKVEEITVSGIIFNYNGNKFRMRAF